MKNVLLLLISIFLVHQGVSQSYQYHPFPTNTGTWKYEVIDEQNNHIDWIAEEFVLGGQGSVDTLVSANGAYYEDSKRIYYSFDPELYPFECVLDFNLTVGDSVFSYFYGEHLHVISDDSVSAEFGGRRALQIGENTIWVEGIGNVTSYSNVFQQIAVGAIFWQNHFTCLIADGASVLVPACEAVDVQDSYSVENLAYPNPTQGIIRVDKRVREIRIYNALGAEITNQVAVNYYSNTVDLTGLTKGIYFCHLIGRDGKGSVTKFIKN